MSGPDYFVKSLIRNASILGRDVLEQIVLGEFKVVSKNSGKTLTGSSIGGKSFSFQVPASLSTDQILAKAEEALEWFDGSTKEQIKRMLSTRPITVVRGRF